MTPARGLLVALGAAFLAAGAYVAAVVDPLAGVAVLVVGAFLLILPFTSARDE